MSEWVSEWASEAEKRKAESSSIRMLAHSSQYEYIMHSAWGLREKRAWHAQLCVTIQLRDILRCLIVIAKLFEEESSKEQIKSNIWHKKWN